MYEKCKVVMLPTSEAKTSHIGYDLSGKLLTYYPGKARYLDSPQYLYIVSNDKIQPNDWCLLFDSLGHIFSSIPGQYKPRLGHVLNDGLRKIIASTDPKLELPRPSDAFIKKYCEAQGIDEVLVEYEEVTHIISPYGDSHEHNAALAALKPSNIIGSEIKLKVAKDNTITIKPVKNSWTRDEMETLLHQMYSDCTTEETYDGSHFDYWIKKNLL